MFFIYFYCAFFFLFLLTLLSVSNDISPDIHFIFVLVLNVCFSFILVRPRFKVRPLNTTAVEGNSAMLHCVAIGDPLPTVQWDRNNKVNSFDFQRFKVCRFETEFYECRKRMFKHCSREGAVPKGQYKGPM